MTAGVENFDFDLGDEAGVFGVLGGENLVLLASDDKCRHPDLAQPAQDALEKLALTAAPITACPQGPEERLLPAGEQRKLVAVMDASVGDETLVVEAGLQDAPGTARVLRVLDQPLEFPISTAFPSPSMSIKRRVKSRR